MGAVFKVLVTAEDLITAKIATEIDDNDINKPVKLSASDLVDLCSDGDQIYGFIDSIDQRTEDGYQIITVQIGGRKMVTLDGASAVGTLVEAAANTAAKTALGANWGLVSTHTAVVGTDKRWKIIRGTGLDEADVLIEKQ